MIQLYLLLGYRHYRSIDGIFFILIFSPGLDQSRGRQVSGQKQTRVCPDLHVDLLQQLRRRPGEDHRQPPRGTSFKESSELSL